MLLSKRTVEHLGNKDSQTWYRPNDFLNYRSGKVILDTIPKAKCGTRHPPYASFKKTFISFSMLYKRTLAVDMSL
jgi:hypothetical protein